MKPTPDVVDALDRFALEQNNTREDALAVIARDWLIGQGYLGSTKSPGQNRTTPQ